MKPPAQPRNKSGHSTSTCLFIAMVASTPVLVAADATWNVNADGSWSTAGSWNPSGQPGQQNGAGTNTDTATFGSIITADRVVSGLNNTGIKNILFNASFRYTFGSGGFRLTNGGKVEIQSAATGSVAIATNISLYGDYSFLANGATSSVFTISGNLSKSSGAGLNTLTIGGTSGTLAAPNLLGSDITNGTGTLGLVKDGSSVWALSRTNAFTGGVLIKAGTLIAQGQPAALGAAASTVTLGDTVAGQDVTLHIGPGLNSVANPLSVASGAGTRTLSFNATSGGASTYSGAITLSKDLQVTNSGSQGFTVGTGAVSGTGNVTFENASSGTLTASGSSINHVGEIKHTGAGNGALTVSGVIGANVTGLVQDSSTSKLTLSNSNPNFAGTAQVLAGTLEVTHATGLSVANTVSVKSGATFSIGVATLTIAGLNDSTTGGLVNKTTAGILTLGGSGNYAFSGNIAPTTVGNLSLTKSGVGTQILAGTNTYTGATLISGGTLQLGNGGTTGSLSTSSTITNNANLTINRSNTVTQGTDFRGSVVITGSGSLTQAGSGTTILNVANTYAGATTVNAGTLVINGDQSGATGAVTVAAGSSNATAVRLSGTGTVGGHTSFTADPDGAGDQVGGIHAPGDSSVNGGVGKQTFDRTGAPTTDLTYNAGSIFEWQLGVTVKDSDTVGALRGTDWDAVNVTGTLGGADAIFRVVLNGSQTFADTFWNADHQWTDIFKTGDAGSLVSFASIFSGGGFQYFNTSTGSIGSSGGTFGITGSTLTWTAVPEPTGALAGILVAAGLLRRRRD